MEKEEVRLSFFTKKICYFMQKTQQKLLELISKFSKDAGFKITIQKSIMFLQASNELFEITI